MRSPGHVVLGLALFALPALGQDTVSAPIDTSYVEYHDSPITLPLGIGLRMPGYDRVNGLSLPWGPKLELGDEKLVVDGLVTYRSHLGKWDPSIEATARPAYGDEVAFYIGRATFTNDAWIRSDLINSAAALFVGSDARNYYRADKVSLRYSHDLTSNSFTVTPFLGGGFERDWSTGSLNPVKRPWSFYGRDGALRMRRPNPAVMRKHIGSIVGGSEIRYFRDDVDGKLAATVEHALSGDEQVCGLPPSGPAVCALTPGNFTQTTIESTVQFPTFGTQTFAFRAHALLSGSNVPPQRYGYMGGDATLATVNLLALGGDRLLYIEGEYDIPLKIFQLPFLGGPFVALRYAAGNAGVRKLPPLIQNVGIGVGVGVLRVDYAIDPARNRSPFSRKSAVTWGISLPR